MHPTRSSDLIFLETRCVHSAAGLKTRLRQDPPEGEFG